MMGIFLIASAGASDLNENMVSDIDGDLVTIEEIEVPQEELSSDNVGELSANNGSEVLENTYYPTDFNDLKSKVSGAMDNDTIVLNGTYSFASEITVNKKLNFVGINNATVDGLSQVGLFKINAADITFKDITFKNGSSEENGGAIAIIDSNNTFYAHNCIFVNNYAKMAGGAMYGGTAVDCKFIRNFAGHSKFFSSVGYGGAMYGSSAVNCTFINNSVRGDDGGAMFSGSAVDCIFINNSASWGGGAVAYVKSFNCMFIGNSASMGGAVANGNAFNCTFRVNFARQDGGAVYFGYAVNCSFVNNSANRYGGAIYGGSAVNCSFKGHDSNVTYNTDDILDCIFDVYPSGHYHYTSFLTVNDLSIVQGDDGIITAKLTNILGPIKDKIITFNLNGKEYNRTTNDEGLVSISVKNDLTDLGKYKVNVTFVGDDLNDMVESHANVKINMYKANLTVVQNGKYYDDTVLTFKLIDSKTNEGIPYASIKLIFSNGNVISLTTGYDGSKSYNVPFDPGTYNLTAYIDSSDVDVNIVEVKNLTINEITGKINVTQVSNSRFLKITLYNPEDGNLYRNIRFSLEFLENGEYVELKTNDEGIAIYNIPFAKGTYSVLAKVSGNYKKFNNTILKNIVIDSEYDPTIINNIYSMVTFSNDIIFDYSKSGYTMFAVIGGSVLLENIHIVGHPEIKPKLSGNRIIVSGLKVGKYRLHVITTPFENYYSNDGFVNITVKKVSAAIKVKAISLYHKEGKKWTVKLIDSKTKKGIAKMQINVKVFTGKKYKNYKVKTNSKGVATFKKLNKLSVGKHKVVLSFSKYGYTCKSISKTVKVKKVTALKFVELERPKLNDMGIVSFSVKNKATKKYIKGVAFKVYIYDGKKVSTDELITGSYKTGDGKHHKAYVSLGTNILSVGKHKIVFKPISAKYKGTLTTSITIKKGMAKEGKKYYTVSKGKLSRSTSIKR